MRFKQDGVVGQIDGLYCGAACALYADYWLWDDIIRDVTRVRLDNIMRTTGFGCGCVNSLGSSPANIAKYLKEDHYGDHPDANANENANENAKIYAPTEILSNWSLRPWYPVLRMGLMTACGTISWSCGFKQKTNSTIIGDDYLIIHFVSKNACFCHSDYWNSHFVVETFNSQIMDPAGNRNQGSLISSQNWAQLGYTSRGLDLYIFKN